MLYTKYGIHIYDTYYIAPYIYSMYMPVCGCACEFVCACVCFLVLVLVLVYVHESECMVIRRVLVRGWQRGCPRRG